MNAPDRSRLQTADDPATTQEFILEARRPILVQRHRAIIAEMEAGLGDALVSGTSDNPRARTLLADLDQPAMQDRVRMALIALVGDGHYLDVRLRDALVEELCLWRARAGADVAVAELQLHAIGIYRLVRQALLDRQGEPAPALDELRALPVAGLDQLLAPLAPTFAQPVLHLVRTPAYGDRCLKTVKRLVRATPMDEGWDDADGGPVLTPEEQEPLDHVPAAERGAARALLIQDRIRSRFYRQVFTQYLGGDEFDPREAQAHRHVLAWLQAIDETPHLYPFLQGQTTRQKTFRIAQLTQKIVQIHEVYARLAHAGANPALRAQLEGRPVRERLTLINRAHYPPLPNTPDLTLAALLCPFPAFVAWVQRQVAEREFVIPPDARRA